MKRLLLSTVLALGFAACSEVRNPATGALQYTTLSQADEQRLGAQEHPKILAQYQGAYTDPKAQAYVQSIGQRLVAVSELSQEKFTFTLLDTPIVNAFALPGGYVYVTRGVVALAGDEAELAGVMAHEIGHVTARHTAQRETRSTLAQGASVLGVILGGLFGGDLGAQAAGSLAQSAAPAWLAGYSRDQEFQADELGIRYLTRAGYDPRAMSTFLGRLQGQAELEARQTGQPADAQNDMYADHPRTLDRVARAANEAAGAAGASSKRDQADYLAAVDGLLYGDDPSEGLVIGRTFVQPALKIRFDAPPGFHLSNTPTSVVGQSRQGALMVFDQDRRQTADVASYMRRQWPGQGSLRAVWPTTIDGHDAATGAAVGAIGRQTRQVLVGVIDDQDGRVWRFLFAAPQMDRQNAAAFQQAVMSFRYLSKAEAAGYRGRQIDVHTVRPGETLARLMPSADANLLADVRLLNGLPLEGGEPAAGQKIKLVVPAGAAPARSTS